MISSLNEYRPLSVSVASGKLTPDEHDMRIIAEVAMRYRAIEVPRVMRN